MTKLKNKLLLYRLISKFTPYQKGLVDTKGIKLNDIITSFNLEKDFYIIQGITTVDDYILVTAYPEISGYNSLVYVIKDNKVITTTSIYNNAHVGGICYDPDNKIIWITDKHGCISGYKKDDILNGNTDVKPIYKKVDVGDKLINHYNNKSAAYIAYFNKKIYVGNYTFKDNAIMKEYDINKDGSINLESCVIHMMPKYVQGVTFTNKNDNTYMLVSSSVGVICDSSIKVYNYTKDITDFRNMDHLTYVLNPMLEQITIKDNTLIAANESNARKYKKYTFNRTSDVCIFDLNDIIKENL